MVMLEGSELLERFPIRSADCCERWSMRNRFVLLALILPVVGACSSDSASDTSSAPATTVATAAPQTTPVAATATATTAVVAPAPTDAPGAAPAPAGAAVAVAIADFKFGPDSVNVPVGGSVAWTNDDDQQHTATSAGNFDAGAIQPGGSATVEFPTAGSFAYICSFHPFMMGTVVVG
jgi:plastocyanin